jgi:hypothetical protein
MSNKKQEILDTIYKYESNGNFNRWVSGFKGSPNADLTKMSVLEVLEAQSRSVKNGGGSAAGAGQVIHPTLMGLVNKGVVNAEDQFNENTQNKIFAHLLEQRGYSKWANGDLSTQKFGNNIAKEWAAMPVLQDTYRGKKQVNRGSSYHAGVGSNKARLGAAAFENFLTGGENYLVAKRPEGSMNFVQGDTSGFDFGGVSQKPNEGFWLDDQNDNIKAPPQGEMNPWSSMDISMDTGSPVSPPGAPNGSDPTDAAERTSVNYSARPVRRGQGGGPMLHPDTLTPHWTGFGRVTYADEFADSFIVRGLKKLNEQKFAPDPDFDLAAAIDADGYGKMGKYLIDSTSRPMYELRKQQLEAEFARDRRRQVSNDGISGFLGMMTNPDGLAMLAVPLGVVGSAVRGAGVSAGRSALRGALFTGTAEAAFETGRSRLDPTNNPMESIGRVAGATVGGAAFGGLFGAMAGARMRKGLINDLADEIVQSRGGVVLKDVNGAPIVSTPVRSASDVRRMGKTGVAVTSDGIHVDANIILKRFESGDVPDGVKTPQELVHYEATRLQALAKSGAIPVRGTVNAGWEKTSKPIVSFGKDGKVRINAKELERRIEDGSPITVGKIKNGTKQFEEIEVDSASFKTAAEAKAFVKRAVDAQGKAKNQAEFETMIKADMDSVGAKLDAEFVAKNQAKIKAAEEEARVSIEAFRVKNNKILEDARLEALARVVDGPFKRIHRNAESSELRDIVNMLAYDGGLLMRSLEEGQTLGPSVYSRAKTWDGVVHRLIEREKDVYEKYLGYDTNPRVSGVSINKSFARKRANRERAMPIAEFRDAATKSVMTGVAHKIPEVNEMAAAIRGSFEEFKMPAEAYGILSSRKNLETFERDILKEMERARPERKEELQGTLDEIKRQKSMADGEPSEDYFTRVWSRQSILDNRQAFKERIVKPWMGQQPLVDVWVLSARELNHTLRLLKLKNNPANMQRIAELEKRLKTAPAESKWERIKADTSPKAIDKRADDLIATILDEAEPGDLGMLREAHRPSFGRSRQFNIPNSHLLKEGPNGNGMTDFIETDYVNVMKMYADRMGPAIEMARTFARPADGVNWRDGFDQAVEAARKAEMSAYKGKNFEEHWGKMLEDLDTLKNRVTNRIIKDPSRWDNRVASVLRDWSNVTFMGMAALPTSIEMGKVIMEHGFTKVFHHTFRVLDESMENASRAGIKEGYNAGAIMDIHQGVELASFAQTGFDAVSTSLPEKYLKTFANKFFMYNGLSPMVRSLKQLDLSIRVPDTVRKIVHVGDGVATKAEIEDLARYGISIDTAKRIYKEPIFEENDNWFANTDAWGSEDLVRTFRAAIRQGNENTILLATAADRPTILDGVVYLRFGPKGSKMAQDMGLERVGNAYKVQSGMLTLPFAFWNYGIAATNKIMIAGLDRPSAQKMSGIAAMMGIGYMVTQLKTPNERWNRMSFTDKIGASVDQSGILGVLPMYLNHMQGTVIAATGKNPFPFDPRHGYVPDLPDVAFNLMGAGPSVARNLVQGAATGDVDQMSWALPGRNHILLKGLFDQVVDGYEQKRQ